MVKEAPSIPPCGSQVWVRTPGFGLASTKISLSVLFK
ncbi:rCG48780 [Rattus norvegicus]|uniref:RCG48780 n=1 Tax=Rattus norvegicus TaxID=10116 RepID=A6IG17_RAT|nr:rCG48780 [Rattus norvegicus]